MAEHCCQGKALGEGHDWSCPTQHRPKTNRGKGKGGWVRTRMPECGPNCNANTIPVWKRIKPNGKPEWRHFRGDPNG